MAPSTVVGVALSPSHSLAATGVSIVAVTLFAFALVLLGIALLRLGLRRRAHR